MKKKLFFSWIIIGCIALGIVSCKKESKNNNPEPEYYLKFKKNNTWFTWKNALSDLGPDLDDNSKTNFGFQGGSNDNAEGFGISFQVNGTSINEGSYDSYIYFMSADYTISQGNKTINYSLKTNSVNSSLYTVTLDSINQTSIKGTFTGNFLVNEEDDSDTLAITEGEFFLKRIR